MHFVDLFLPIPSGEDSDETAMYIRIVGTRVRLVLGNPYEDYKCGL